MWSCSTNFPQASECTQILSIFSYPKQTHPYIKWHQNNPLRCCNSGIVQNKVLFDTELNLVIKLLQLPSDTLSCAGSARPALSSLIENSHTGGVIHPGSLFSRAKDDTKGTLSETYTNLPQALTAEEEQPLARPPARLFSRRSA